jgi:hypothetical protein
MWRIFKTVLAAAILFVLLMVAGSAKTLFSLHTWVRDYLGDLTGTDPTVARLMAGAIFALVCLVPWRRLLFAPVTGRPKPLIALAVACLAGASTLKVVNARLKFDESGNPRQSVIETPNGPVIVDAAPGGTDRTTGLTRKPLTAEILRSISLGNGPGGTTVDTNKYFSVFDGKNKAWFVHGTCELRRMNGYDDRGQPLEPATAERVDQCEKIQVEADRRHRQQAAAQEQRERREEVKSRRLRFQSIGRYVASGHFTTLDGIRFFFDECIVLDDELHLKFRVVNVRDDSQISADANSRFEFSIFNESGTETRSKRLRRVQGTVAVNAVDGFLVAPSPGETGWFVVEFKRDNKTAGTFAIVINGMVAFNRPSSHVVSFHRF